MDSIYFKDALYIDIILNIIYVYICTGNTDNTIKSVKEKDKEKLSYNIIECQKGKKCISLL